MHSKYYIPARSAVAPYTVDVTPESAGWTESSLQVVELEPLQEITLDTGDTEVMILPLAGHGTVDCDNESFELSRRSPQLWHRRCFRGRFADRVRGDHSGRQLVELPGAQA